MDLIFIRHGQGQHTLEPPNSLHIKDPSLTNEGIDQAKLLRKNIPLSDTDLVVISPIRRTLQTAFIWSEGIRCKKIVSPMVSPRMFPQKKEWKTLPCDVIMDRKEIKNEFPDFIIEKNSTNDLWIQGINSTSEDEFKTIGKRFIQWCKLQSKEKIYVVSHDGTITSYRQLLSNQTFTRKDFPKEAGWVNLRC
ncbi:histidine phosphatase family protein [Virgibacillus ndiopensis]|uniref:histidine phosphatase family protein n=1 Tax=Virgibacillus ndiopensis TaxID=2004408 RepID=UPI000C0875EE|nr:histidine phosphatase family protein [Virgibacillus ndiopensis]